MHAGSGLTRKAEVREDSYIDGIKEESYLGLSKLLEDATDLRAYLNRRMPLDKIDLSESQIREITKALQYIDNHPSKVTKIFLNLGEEIGNKLDNLE